MKISPHQKDLTGTRVGRLVAVSTAGVAVDGHSLWKCKCDCGNFKIIASNNFRENGGTKSCGCLRSEAQKERIKEGGVWNEGKSYSINNGVHCYKTRHGWAIAAIRKFGNKCQKCGWDKARCDVHHKIEKSKGGLHTLENAEVLCPNCHREHHEIS